MLNEPNSTITSPIYRDIAETINKTTFEVYVKESYRPIVHGYYLDHPEITPIDAPDPFEMDNLCFARLPLKNIIDILATGQEFRWRYSSDVKKAAGFLKAYIDQFEGIPLDKDPEQKAFFGKVKTAYDAFFNYAREREIATTPPKPKRLSIAERIKMLGL